jgi:hypothetical protein
MNFFIKIIIALILAILSLINGGAYTPPKKTVKELIEEAVVTYGYYEDAGIARSDELLQQLKEADPVQGERWSKIMGMWRAGLRQKMNYDVLPDGLPDTDELCIVVLGFELQDDGQMRNELVKRLEIALASANKYKHAYIVCTGGGTASNNKKITEAGQMAKWIISHGIEESRVIIENRSETTAQNAIYTYEILKASYPQVKKIAIVSSDYHIEPSILFFEAISILRGDQGTDREIKVVSNAAWKAPEHVLSVLFRAGGLIEITGDEKTAKAIYNRTYDFESVSPF